MSDAVYTYAGTVPLIKEKAYYKKNYIKTYTAHYDLNLHFKNLILTFSIPVCLIL